MKRLIIICEGETEQEFCCTVLSRYLNPKNIYIQAPRIKKSMGGIVPWQHLKKQIIMHLKEDPSAYVTTLIDYYGIHEHYGFPNWKNAHTIANPFERMSLLEEGILTEIPEDLRFRFIPYIQLHEFEGLIFNSIDIFYQLIPVKELIGVPELEETFRNFDNPELINNSPTTAPSKRLERIITSYNKIVYGNIFLETIGIDKIRSKSLRFDAWLSKIESI